MGFRELLRADAEKREAYAQIKLTLASIHQDDKAAYTAAKAPFIRQMLAGLIAPVPKMPMACAESLK